MRGNRPTVPENPLGSVATGKNFVWKTNLTEHLHILQKSKLYPHNNSEIKIVSLLSECSQHLLIQNQGNFR